MHPISISMPQPPIIISQPADQLLLTLFRLFLFLPRINRLMRQMIINTAIRTTIKCNHSKCTRLLRLDERKHSLHNANQLCRLFFHTQYSISRQQNGIKACNASHPYPSGDCHILSTPWQPGNDLPHSPPPHCDNAEEHCANHSTYSHCPDGYIHACPHHQAITSYSPGITRSSGTHIQFSTHTITSFARLPAE